MVKQFDLSLAIDYPLFRVFFASRQSSAFDCEAYVDRTPRAARLQWRGSRSSSQSMPFVIPPRFVDPRFVDPKKEPASRDKQLLSVHIAAAIS